MASGFIIRTINGSKLHFCKDEQNFYHIFEIRRIHFIEKISERGDIFLFLNIAHQARRNGIHRRRSVAVFYKHNAANIIWMY